MANSKSALKRVRQSNKTDLHNTTYVSRMRSAIKKFRNAVETGEGDVQSLLTSAIKEIDSAAGKGLIHKNKANRDKSKLAKLANK